MDRVFGGKHTSTRWKRKWKKRKEKNVCRIFCHFWKVKNIRPTWDTKVQLPLRVMSGISFRFGKLTYLYLWYERWAVFQCLMYTEVPTSKPIFEQRILSQPGEHLFFDVDTMLNCTLHVTNYLNILLIFLRSHLIQLVLDQKNLVKSWTLLPLLQVKACFMLEMTKRCKHNVMNSHMW